MIIKSSTIERCELKAASPSLHTIVVGLKQSQVVEKLVTLTFNKHHVPMKKGLIAIVCVECIRAERCRQRTNAKFSGVMCSGVNVDSVTQNNRMLA
jgi:hypothetical protein